MDSDSDYSVVYTDGSNSTDSADSANIPRKLNAVNIITDTDLMVATNQRDKQLFLQGIIITKFEIRLITIIS